MAELVVVPQRPGPLIRFESHSREADELDELIDELFGPPDDERAGVFDIALLLGGAGLVAWSAFGTGPTITLVIGLIALGLGVILPVRTAWRAAGSRRRERRREALLAQGVPLRLGHQTTDSLAAAYSGVVDLAAASPEHGDEALRLAHVAMVESATLLEGSLPSAPAEDGYVARRAAAVQGLADVLRARATAPDATRATVAEARAELDSLSGVDVVRQIEDLIAQSKADHGD